MSTEHPYFPYQAILVQTFESLKDQNLTKPTALRILDQLKNKDLKKLVIEEFKTTLRPIMRYLAGLEQLDINQRIALVHSFQNILRRWDLIEKDGAFDSQSDPVECLGVLFDYLNGKQKNDVELTWEATIDQTESNWTCQDIDIDLEDDEETKDILKKLGKHALGNQYTDEPDTWIAAGRIRAKEMIECQMVLGNEDITPLDEVLKPHKESIPLPFAINVVAKEGKLLSHASLDVQLPDLFKTVESFIGYRIKDSCLQKVTVPVTNTTIDVQGRLPEVLILQPKADYGRNGLMNLLQSQIPGEFTFIGERYVLSKSSIKTGTQHSGHYTFFARISQEITQYGDSLDKKEGFIKQTGSLEVILSKQENVAILEYRKFDTLSENYVIKQKLNQGNDNLCYLVQVLYFIYGNPLFAAINQIETPQAIQLAEDGDRESLDLPEESNSSPSPITTIATDSATTQSKKRKQPLADERTSPPKKRPSLGQQRPPTIDQPTDEPPLTIDETELPPIDDDLEYMSDELNQIRDIFTMENSQLQPYVEPLITKQPDYLQAIHYNSNDYVSYNALAITLPPGGSIRLLDGRVMTQRQLFLAAIHLAAQTNYIFAAAYRNLAAILPLKSRIELLDGTLVTQQQLLLVAIHYDCNNPIAYHHLALTLSSTESVILFNNKAMTPRDLCLEAIRLDCNYSSAYNTLGNTLALEESILMPNGVSMTKQELNLKAIQLNGNSPYPYIGLIKTLPQGLCIHLPDNTIMTRQDLCRKAFLTNIYYDRLVYWGLAKILNPEEQIEISDNETISKKRLSEMDEALHLELAAVYKNLTRPLPYENLILLRDSEVTNHQERCLKAIELDSTCSLAYCYLADALNRRSSIQLHDGTKMTKIGLYLKARSLDRCSPYPYIGIANTLTPGGIAILDEKHVPKGRITTLSQEEALLQAFQLNSNGNNDPIIYTILGKILQSGEHIKLPNGNKVTNQKLFQKAIQFDPLFAAAYYNLALTLSVGETTTLPDNRLTTQQELLCQVIQLDNNHFGAYNFLAETLPSNGAIQLLNGTTMTKEQLYLKAIELDSTKPNPYIELARMLTQEGSIQTPTKQTMNRQDLCLKAFELCQTDSQAFYKLGAILFAEEYIQLPNGKKITKQILFILAIQSKSNFAAAYHKLAMTISPNETIKFNGKTVTRRYLLELAIFHDDQFAAAYYSLAMSISPGEKVLLAKNRKIMTRLDLLLLALDLYNKSPNEISQKMLPYIYGTLAKDLPTKGSAMINKTQMSKTQLTIQALKLHNHSSVAYRTLADNLPIGSFLHFLGMRMNQQDLYRAVIQLNDKDSLTYNNLAWTLPSEGSVVLCQDTIMTQTELYLKAIELDSTNFLAYNNLADTLILGGSIQLLNGTLMTQEELYLKAISLYESFVNAYFNLLRIVPPGGEVQLSNNVIITQKDLYDRAHDYNRTFVQSMINFSSGTTASNDDAFFLNPTCAKQTFHTTYEQIMSLIGPQIYCNIADNLPEEGRIELLDGTIMNRQQIRLKANSKAI